MHPVNYFAYLDAGTGSLIIQSLVGIFAGIIVFARKLIFGVPHKIKSFFKKDKKTEDTKDTKPTSKTDK